MAEAAAKEAKPAVVEDTRTGLAAFWAKLDTNKSGVIEGKEWGSVVSKNLDEFKKWFPGETVQDMGKYFRTADADHDKVITWSEFVAAADMGSLKKLFLQMDKNADGKVDSKEWGRNLKEFFPSLKGVFGGKTLADVGKKFNEFNTDLSASLAGNQYLSWDEFQTAWFNTEVTQEFLDLRKLWDNMNVDKDGFVTSKEWGSVINKNKELMYKIYGGKTLADIGTRFNPSDANGDKKLTWTELVKGYTSAVEIGELKKIFMEMDKSGDGFVDSKEWGRQLKAYSGRLGEFFMGKSLSDLGKMFNSIDTNKDDHISWDEIQAAVVRDQDAREEAQELKDVAKIDAVNCSKINFLEKNLVLKKAANAEAKKA